MATRYEKGRRFEYAVMKELKKMGFYVIRSAGSKGIADLVAIRGDEVILIQCKSYRPSDSEISVYREQIDKFGIKLPMHIYYKDGGKKGIIPL